jgi:hypothetical protein
VVRRLVVAIAFLTACDGKPPNTVPPEQAAATFLAGLGYKVGGVSCAPGGFGHWCTARVADSDKTFKLECATVGGSWTGCAERMEGQR